MDNITIKISGKETTFTWNEANEVFGQLRRIMEREDVTNTLGCCDRLYTDKMVEWMLDSMWEYLWNDNDFCCAYDNVITDLADTYVENLKEMLRNRTVRFKDRQEARAELKELEETA